MGADAGAAPSAGGDLSANGGAGTEMSAGGDLSAGVEIVAGAELDVVALAPRLVLGLEAAGGWRDTTVALPDGDWLDVLTGRKVTGGGPARLADLLGACPVALLARQGGGRP
jgi:(1->4)-alpha-D-glucan 1-alpha-D-glucosylmutase